ncbi:hypothetical protein ACFWXA_30685 [Streptomyces atroolivaceus]|uniref:hypothetical protein n=1 Tax=Streptomyces atroolivaceus TaxID=66869 RepID=UPI00364BCDFF
MAILFITNASGTVTETVNVGPAPVLPPASRTTTPLPANDFGTCEDCGEDLVPLINNAGEVRTVFCEPCEYGV